MKETILHAEIYRRGVAVLQGTEEELKQYFTEHNLDVAQVTDADWENTKGMCYDDGSDVFVYSVKPMDLYTLIHELSHATFKILEIVGISPTLAEEAYTYDIHDKDDMEHARLEAEDLFDALNGRVGWRERIG